ncbi:MAG: 23S rRNA (adenine(2503)-C(2))-methyltransferase RlmN [Deltaproteobacteria bacterium]|nr:23S rRNA (adenine(2503)-C(2))-methyltransferase RlmN [Deltaproteobacteria bacterium]
MPHFTGPDGRIDIKSLELVEIEAALQGMGSERFRALQVYKWLWQRGVRSFDEMTNVAKPVRALLAERFYISWLTTLAVQKSVDGTHKFLWQTEDGHRIESVLIPDDERMTLCVSTQVGCAMACSFCLTGDLGLRRNLRPSEIANQPLQVRQALEAQLRISNVVMMGMGEPLHNVDNLIPALRIYLDEQALNFSHRKITVSTVGLVPQMQKLADTLPVNLAVSLNATTEEQRRQVMPITRKYSMMALLDACRELPLPNMKRITFEYVMMAGFNDSMDDAVRLARLMRGIKSKVNLIPYNENPDREIRRPPDSRVKQFQHYLVNHGIQASVRVTRGRDISAACGQLGKAAERSDVAPGEKVAAVRIRREGEGYDASFLPDP